MTEPRPFPAPPAEVLDGPPTVAPALDVEAWVLAEFLAPDRPMSIYEHSHLAEHEARVGWLWATEVLVKRGRRILGRCGLAQPTGDAWQQLHRTEQLERWFGEVPDFVVTLDAQFVAHALATGRVADVLALVDHELCHAGIALDADGFQRFRKDGSPVWGIRTHDVEQFLGPVRRWGLASAGVEKLAEAIDHVRAVGPDIAQATLDGVCGTCRAGIGAVDE